MAGESRIPGISMDGVRGFFVTGTDTGVGKTFVACALARHLSRTHKVGVMKPAESGCRRAGGILSPADAVKLKAASGSAAPMEDICPYPLPGMLAPSEAARRAGICIDMERIRRSFERVAAVSDVVLVEGAGGLLVPLRDDCLFVDLARDLRLPLLIVARAGLGTINHSLLTLEAALSRGIVVSALILNENTPPGDDRSIAANAAALARLASVPVLGPFPFLSGPAGGIGPESTDLLDQLENLLNAGF
ncbi:MAG: dethiobiotin synthase [Syntrophobacteraceae bacterium]|nr:dethiobiotin synthase [Syntrophobacteraceae bacterium]